MRPSRRWRGWEAVLEALLLLLVVGTNPARGEEAGGKFVKTGVAAAVGERAGLSPAGRFAILRARKALADPGCRQIFLDFRDSSGRVLQDRLDALGWSAQRYLDSMIFYETAHHQSCSDPRTLAMTTPGSRVVFFCRSKFSNLIRREPSALWVAVLHEELHSMGLGENPPTSVEISRRIAQRCH
jgi:hypothetical protein